MDLPDSRSTQPGWLPQCGRRLKAAWLSKLIGLTTGMGAFFAVYFWIIHHPHSPPEVMPLTVMDHWIEFWPAALPLYLSLWIYVSLAPALANNSRELIDYAWEAVMLGALGLGIFFIWPTTVPQRDTDWSQHPGFSFLKTIDASGNACPSLHVAFAIIAALWLDRILCATRAGLSPRALNWLWCLGITYSTLAVRQHVFIDVFAGAALGLGVAAAFSFFNAKKRRAVGL